MNDSKFGRKQAETDEKWRDAYPLFADKVVEIRYLLGCI